VTAADGYARDVAEFLDAWDAAPAHRAGYRDVISSQKTGEDGRKLRASTLRKVLAERADLAEKLAEMTQCRDAAVRLAEREHVEIEFDLDGNLRDGLVGIAEWEHPGEPDHAPDWLIDAVVRVVRPKLARLTERCDGALGLIDASAGMFGATREQLLAADEEHPTPELIEVGRKVRDQITAWLAEHDTEATNGANPDVCRDCYGRGDDFEGGACGRCRGTGAAA